MDDLTISSTPCKCVAALHIALWRLIQPSLALSCLLPTLCNYLKHRTNTKNRLLSCMCYFAAWRSKPAEHRDAEGNWVPFGKKKYTIDQISEAEEGQNLSGNQKELTILKSKFSFCMETVACGFWTDFSRLCFLVTSSVSPPFLHCCSGTVSHSAGNIHPPSSLSNLLSIYSRQNSAGGCLTSLFFWTEAVGNFQLWQTLRREVLKEVLSWPRAAWPGAAGAAGCCAGSRFPHRHLWAQLCTVEQPPCKACSTERESNLRKTDSSLCILQEGSFSSLLQQLKLPDSFFFRGKGLNFCKRWLVCNLGLLSWERDHTKHMAILRYFLLPTCCKEGLSIFCCFINSWVHCSDDTE